MLKVTLATLVLLIGAGCANAQTMDHSGILPLVTAAAMIVMLLGPGLTIPTR